MLKNPVTWLLLLVLLICAQPVLAGQVTTFIYHRFDEPRYPSTNISADVFRQQLQVLKDEKYQVLSLGEVARRLAVGEPLPEKGAAICVDDAFDSFVQSGMPILKEFGFPVTLFVNTDGVGTRGYLSWQQLAQLQSEGVEIGNHTATHDYLVEMRKDESFAGWKKRIEEDIDKAAQQYRKHLGAAPKVFAYPYGEYTPELMQLLEDKGFVAAFAQQSGVIHSGSNRFSLPRFPMGGPYATLDGFSSKLAMRALVVEAQSPVSPVVAENPPTLELYISDSSADLRQLNCFVQGDNSCSAEPLDGRPGWYRIEADKPLSGRRNKFTLTARGKQGSWHWFSQLWINAINPAMATSSDGSGLAVETQIDGSETNQSVLPDQGL